MKQSRFWSFAVMTAIYAVATAFAVVLFNFLPWNMWLSLLVTDVATTVLVFVFSLIFRNASVYDPYWSVQPIVIVIAFAWGKSINIAQILLIVAVIGWGLRLTGNWAYTFHNLTCQDWRYTMLHDKTGKWYPVINFVGIHLVPTLVVYGCILPVAFALTSEVAVNALECVFVAVSVGAFVMQGIADVQMQRYRANRTTPFIRTGLWKYSRHPNYLGEILMWWGIALACLSLMPDKWYLVAGAVANTVLFLVVSIPMADNRQSRKNGFGEYKAQTRVLLPIPKRVKQSQPQD